MADLLKVSVERIDGEKAVYPVLPKTRVNFERQFRTPLGHFVQEPYDERLYWMAWDAEKVSGKVVKPFDSWLDDIAAVEIVEEPAPLDDGEATSA
jgi:hypothetical protein